MFLDQNVQSDTKIEQALKMTTYLTSDGIDFQSVNIDDIPPEPITKSDSVRSLEKLSYRSSHPKKKETYL